MTALALRSESRLGGSTVHHIDDRGCAVRFGQYRVAIASRVEEVVAAWGVVHDVYAQSSLIEANPYGLHTAIQAIDPDTAVIYSSVGTRFGSTMTVIPDRDAGLPLDRVYPDHLDQLRENGRRLVEIGLFADSASLDPATPSLIRPAAHTVDVSRYPMLRRLSESMVHIMKLAFCYSLSVGATDMTIGVHPKHTGFYRRAWGFEIEAGERIYPAVNDAPVVLMRCNMIKNLEKTRRPDGVAYCVDSPPNASAYERRFSFDPARVCGPQSLIGAYLRLQYPGWGIAA